MIKKVSGAWTALSIFLECQKRAEILFSTTTILQQPTNVIAYEKSEVAKCLGVACHGCEDKSGWICKQENKRASSTFPP